MSTVLAHPVETQCLNCGTVLHGPYCAQCGQRAGHVRPTLHTLLHELLHEFLHVDGKIVQSIRLLFTRPGFLTREYFDGRHARHISPLRLYLTFSVLFFAVSAYVAVKPEVTYEAGNKTAIRISGLRIASDTLFANRPAEELAERVVHANHDWPPRMLFLLVPLCALIVMRATRGSGRYYPEHLWFALHGHAAYFGVWAVTLSFELLYNPRISATLTVVRAAFLLWYGIVSFHTAYGGRWRTAVRRTVFVGAGYGLLVVAAMVTLFVAALLA